MTVRRSIIPILAALIAALSAAPATAQDPFINGDFSLYPFSNGWDLVDGNIDLWSPLGDNVVDLNGSEAGAIAQTFDTDAGVDYVVSFKLAGNWACGDPLKTLKVSAAGESEIFTHDTPARPTTDDGNTIIPHEFLLWKRWF